MVSKTSEMTLLRTKVAELTAREEQLRRELQQLRRQKGEHLEGREDFLRAVLETSMDGFWVIDATGAFREVNEAYCAMLGYTREELLGMNIAALDAEETPAKIATRIKEMSANASELFETRHRRKDGSIFPMEVSTTWLDEDGGHLVCFCHDLTDRHEVEKALQQSEGRLSHILDNAIWQIWAFDGLYFTYLNRAYYDFTGLRVDNQHKIEAWTSFIHPEDYRAAMQLWNQAWDAKEEFDSCFRMKNQYGEYRDFWCRAVPIFQTDGGLSHYQGFNIDITERNQAKTQQEKLQEQLAHAQKMESAGRLAGGIAHDFNNMLGVILGYSELLLAQIGENQLIRPALQGIQEAAERSAELTRQLLAFARKQAVVPRKLELNRTLEGMLKMLQRLTGEDIDLAWVPGEGLGQIKIDPSQLDQIMVNLCANAREAITDTGRISIETGSAVLDHQACEEFADALPGEYVTLAVRDTGCGIHPDALPHLFEPFYTTKEHGQGTGLGLSTVYGIVKQNSGFLRVESVPGQGTTLKIYLPRYREENEERSETVKREPAATGTETILLVEDEAMILEMTTMMLQGQGYRILPAATPGEAIRLAEAHGSEIGLLISDLVMPEMNGRDLADKLMTFNPRLKRLFMSGYTASVIARHGVLEEGIHFIQKPFSRSAIAAKIREVLDQPPA